MLFVYPVHSNATINHFEATILNRDTHVKFDKLILKIKKKEEARDIFEAKTTAGYPAIISALDSNALDSLTVELGIIPENHIVQVNFNYIMRMTLEPKKLPSLV